MSSGLWGSVRPSTSGAASGAFSCFLSISHSLPPAKSVACTLKVHLHLCLPQISGLCHLGSSVFISAISLHRELRTVLETKQNTQKIRNPRETPPLLHPTSAWGSLLQALLREGETGFFSKKLLSYLLVMRWAQRFCETVCVPL